ncbi:hypothetical protein AB0H36_46800 [Kribbella sp. NPDC050820]|uniref:hypothetical protein n=1 Tax=Kribbella sp. NPDC050820 TaxID=3155408 RepID=UPI0033C73185
MWDFANAVPEYHRYLVITTEPTPITPTDHVILYGDLFTLDERPAGQAALVEAPTPEAAASLLPGAEAHPWEFGGRR